MSDSTSILSSYLVERAATTLPGEVDRATRIFAVDSIGCAAAGVQTAHAKAAHQVTAAMGGTAEAAVIGHDVRLPVANAAFYNTLAARAQIFDDSNGRGLAHADSALTFTGLAIAEARDLTLTDVVRAVALGAEIAARIGHAAGEVHYEGGFHHTGTCVVFGTAATAACLLGLSPDETTQALCLAADHAAGLRQYQVDGDRADSALHAANAARSGVHSAHLARSGFPAPAGMLDGRFGFFAAYRAEPDARERLLEDLGAQWRILESSIKPYPSCRSSHAAATAIENLRRDYGLNGADVKNIRIRVSEHAYKCDRPFPTNSLDAQFSIQYAVARILVYGSLADRDFGPEFLGDPATTQAQELIRVDCDPRLESTACVFEADLADGRTLVEEVPVGMVRGDPENPFTVDEMFQKYRGNVGDLWTDEQARAVFDMVTSGPGSRPVRDIVAGFAAKPR